MKLKERVKRKDKLKKGRQIEAHSFSKPRNLQFALQWNPI